MENNHLISLAEARQLLLKEKPKKAPSDEGAGLRSEASQD